MVYTHFNTITDDGISDYNSYMLNDRVICVIDENHQFE